MDWNYLKEHLSETGTLPLEAKLRDKQGGETSISLLRPGTIYTIFP